MPDAAVLTGDLISSRKAGPEAVERAMADIAGLAQDMSAPFARYRGDGWQVLVLQPQRALRFSLLITARLRSHRAPLSRFAIGIGAIAGRRAPSLSAETGEAFVASGELLDDMPRRSTFAITSLTRRLDPMTWAAARLADQVARRWTPPQAEAMTLALASDQPTGTAIARALGISAAAASYRLQGASSSDIKAVVTAFEQQLGAK